MKIEETKDGGFNKNRGRPRIRRRMSENRTWRCFSPQCNTRDDTGFVSIRPEEIELLRLIDLEGMEQEEAAVVLGVSRKTVWKDIHDARMKVTDALINGKIIEIRDCTFRSEGSCPKENDELCPKNRQICPVRKESSDFDL